MSEKVNFEEAIKELEAIASKLEHGELNIDESIKFFEQGMKLSKECTDYLQEVEKKITNIIEKEGKIVEESNEVF